jgi:putative hydrolase
LTGLWLLFGRGIFVKFEADLHIHTVASGHAFSTFTEIVQAAVEKGLKLIAITDHGPGLPGGAHSYHFWNLRVLPREEYGVKILRGVEANIVDADGNVDLEEDLLKALDIVHVGFHPRCGYEDRGAEKNTDTLIKVMRNPLVDVVVHPGNPKFPINIERVVDAAGENQVLLEINNSSFLTSTSRAGSYEIDLGIVTEAKKRGLEIIVGSDAHFEDAVGNFDAALEVVKAADFPMDKILNTTAEKVIQFLEKKKNRKIF